MASRTFLSLLSLSTILSGMSAIAQTEEVADSSEEKVLEAVRVVGSRFVKQALSEIDPETRLNTEDIAAYGASTIGELLEELGPEIASGRGRGDGAPIVLVDGVRVASFREVRSYPSEAVQRMDVLPEEAALKFGYGADQRVINIVLKPEFSAVTVEFEVGGPTQGAGLMTETKGGYLGIKDSRRTSFNAELETDEGVLESDRGLSTALGEDSLRAETQDISIDGSFHKPFANDVRMTLSGDLDQNQSDQLLGFSELDFVLPGGSPFSTTGLDSEFSRLAGVPGVLMRESETLGGNVSLTFTRDIENWFVTSLTRIGRTETDTTTDRAPDASAYQAALSALDPNVSPSDDLTPYLAFRMEETQRTTTTASTNLLANGRLWELPAGNISTGLSVDLSHVERSSVTLLDGIQTETELDRQIGKIQGSFDVPLVSDDMEIPGIYDLTANVTAAASEYSDFGSLFNFDGTLSWKPIEQVRLIGSYTFEEGAPGMSQLGDTISLTPNVDVFDFVLGQSVVATRVDGGNPDLKADKRQVFKVSSEIKPWEERDLRLNLTYIDTHIDDPIGSFPGVDVELQAAFPTRFVRDANGDLISYDTRPLNYVEETRRHFEWRLFWRKSFDSAQGGARGGRAPAGGPRTAPPDRAAFAGAGGGAQFGRMRELMSTEEGRAKLRAAFEAVDGETAPSTPEEMGARIREMMGTEEGRTKLREVFQSLNSEGDAAANGAAPQAGQPGQRPAAPDGAQRAQNRPAASGGGRGPGMGGPGGRGRGGGGPRLFVSLRHVFNLEDQRLLVDGYPVQDFLNGSARGSTGGKPEHELDLRAGFFHTDFGSRLSVSWQSGTEVNSGAQTVSFSDFTKTDLRFFYNVRDTNALGRKFTWLQGARLSLEIDNLFDEVIEVSDGTGIIPTRYEPDRLDPLGRVVQVSFRKQF